MADKELLREREAEFRSDGWQPGERVNYPSQIYVSALEGKVKEDVPIEGVYIVARDAMLIERGYENMRSLAVSAGYMYGVFLAKEGDPNLPREYPPVPQDVEQIEEFMALGYTLDEVYDAIMADLQRRGDPPQVAAVNKAYDHMRRLPQYQTQPGTSSNPTVEALQEAIRKMEAREKARREAGVRPASDSAQEALRITQRRLGTTLDDAYGRNAMGLAEDPRKEYMEPRLEKAARQMRQGEETVVFEADPPREDTQDATFFDEASQL